MRKKNTLAGVLSAAMVMGSLTLPVNISGNGFDFGALFAQAADEVASGTCGENLTWVLDDEGVLTISGSGDMDDYINYFYQPWFSVGESITAVVIDDGVTSIGSYAFQYCTNLTNIQIADTVTKISSYAFDWCNSLTSVVIPTGVTEIEAFAFGNGHVLEEIIVEADNEYYASLDGVLYDKTYTTLVRCPNAMSGDIEVLDGVTEIADGAFLTCDIENVTLPDSVTTIGVHAFESCCYLKNMTLPDSVTKIKEGAFYYCSFMESIELSAGLKTIGDNAFWYCPALTEVIIPDGVESIGAYAFKECSGLESVTLSDTLTTIGEGAFIECGNLENIVIPTSVTQIGSTAFTYTTFIYVGDNEYAEQYCIDNEYNYYDKDGMLHEGVSFLYDYQEDGTIEITQYYGTATDVVIPSEIDGVEVTSIGYEAFYHRSDITSVEIPNTVTKICMYAFDSCISLTSIEIPESVTEIGIAAFELCSELTYVKICGAANICESAFYFCEKLSTVDMGCVVTIGDGAFYGTAIKEFIVDENNELYATSDGILYNKDMTTLICCPGGKEGTVEIPEGVSSIADTAFAHCGNITEIIIPDTVTEIGIWAFAYCYQLTELVIPEGVTIIPDYAFIGCTSLESVSFLGDVIEIGDWAFEWCYKLTDIDLPDALTHIGECAFLDCISMYSIEIPASVTEMDNMGVGYISVYHVDENNTYYYDDYELLDESFTIYGYSGSEAEIYASENGINFIDVTSVQDIGNVEADFSNASLASGETLSGDIEIVADLVFEGEYLESEEGQTLINEVIDPINNGDVNLTEVIDTFVSAEDNSAFDISDYSLLTDIFDLKIKSCDEVVEGVQNISVSFEVYGLEDTMEIAILHFNSVSGVWEVYENPSTEGNVVTVTFSSLSPVGVIYKIVEAEIPDESEYNLGDANGDDTINYLDAMAVLRYDAELMEMTTVQLAAADVNDDGSVNSLDAILILRYDAGLIVEFQ